jgi:hypothetical protein
MAKSRLLATNAERKAHWVTYVRDDGECIDKEVQRITPDRLKTSCPEGSRYVVRFGPRSKLWELYDLRRYIMNPSIGQFYAAPPPTVTHVERGAVLGYAMIMP